MGKVYCNDGIADSRSDGESAQKRYGAVLIDFILLGGPLVESTQGDLRFTAPLTGITAAVVGVILNLAAFFAWHVLWPDGFSGRFDAFSLVVGLAALGALWRYKVGIIAVILACEAAGLVLRLAGAA